MCIPGLWQANFVAVTGTLAISNSSNLGGLSLCHNRDFEARHHRLLVWVAVTEPQLPPAGGLLYMHYGGCGGQRRGGLGHQRPLEARGPGGGFCSAPDGGHLPHGHGGQLAHRPCNRRAAGHPERVCGVPAGRKVRQNQGQHSRLLPPPLPPIPIAWNFETNGIFQVSSPLDVPWKLPEGLESRRGGEGVCQTLSALKSCPQDLSLGVRTRWLGCFPRRSVLFRTRGEGRGVQVVLAPKAVRTS